MPIGTRAFFDTDHTTGGQINMGEGLSGQVQEQMNVGAQYAGYGEGQVDPRAIAMRIIMIVLTFLGVVFAFLIVLSGYWLITSRGEEEKITKARKTIQGAIIGLIIVLLSYSIAYFVGRRMESAVGTYNQSPQFE